MSIYFKKATPVDIPILLELEKSVAGTNIYSPMLDASEWTDELQKNVVFLIKKDDMVVGNLSYEKKNNNHVYISGLVIDPAFQRQGVAREVLTKLLNELKNTTRIDLAVHPDNHRALELYKSVGFVVESRKENYYEDGEPRLILVLGDKRAP